MRTLLMLLREVWAGLFRKHSHCRVCDSAIEEGGAALPFVGRGFCHGCAAEIRRRVRVV